MNRFKKAYIKNFLPLVSYAMNFVKSQEEAEDIVQEVFLKIWNEGKLPEIKKLDNYLLYSVRNMSISYLRKQKRTNMVSMEVANPEREHIYSLNKDPAEDEEYINMITELYLEINNLPPKCKEVFLLVKFQGYTYQEAAKQQKVSINTVKKQIGKALRHFRTKLLNDGE